VPRVRVVGVVLLGVVLYAYGSTSEVPWLFLLAYWLWALALAAALYAAWNARGLEASAALRPSDSLFEGDEADLVVGLRSLRGTRGPARVSGLVAGRPAGAGAGRVPEGGVEELRGLGALRRGVVRSSGFVLESGDPIGLFSNRRTLPDRELALVFPHYASLGGLRRQREVEAALAAPRAGSGNEIFGVREYQRGDPLRRIHWRTSARRGELVVREFEPPGQRTLTVVLDAAPASLEAADQAARLAASEAWDCLREGGRATLWAPGLEPSSHSWWELLEWLARYPELPAAESAPPPAGEAVAITSGAEPAVFEALAELRRRGAEERTWRLDEVGLAWPLD
jgi:uncharacterized protein (DUF58 family)